MDALAAGSLVAKQARVALVSDVVDPETATVVRRLFGTPIASASSASVGLRPNISASRARAGGSCSALRPMPVLLRSWLTTIRSPTTRTLWLCESLSSTATVAITAGRRGSAMSRMVVPRPSALGRWPT